MIQRPLQGMAFVAMMVLLFMAILGCEQSSQSIPSNHPDLDSVEAAIRKHLSTSTLDQRQAWREFESVFPQSIQSFGIRWNANVGRFTGNAVQARIFLGRYVLKIILDLDVSRDLKAVNVKSVRYHFYEVTSVRRNPGGGAAMSISTTNQKYFDRDQWIALTNSGWNFQQLGVTVVSNRPVPNIDLLTNP